MPSFHHLASHMRQYGMSHTALYLLSFSIFFLMVFDGIIAYLVPLLITERGFSLSAMGLIIGSSSVAGALIDLLFTQIRMRVHFRYFFFIAFIIAAAYAYVVFHADTVSLFLFAMALWGVYWDLYVFGSFDFVARYTKKSEHTSSFGVLLAFAALGGLIAPLIAAQASEKGYTPSFIAAGVALACSVIIFLGVVVFLKAKKSDIIPLAPKRKKTLFSELRLLKRLGVLLFPPILLTFFLHTMNGLFWTLAPLYPLHDGGSENALFLIAYELPALFVGWFVGSFTAKYGKKHIAFLSLLIGSCILAVTPLSTAPAVLIGGVFCASFFLSAAFPAINGAYADYISEAPVIEEDIEGVQDMCANLGYVISPVIAGILAEHIGIPMTFTLFGAAGIIAGTFLLTHSQKSIRIRVGPMV